MSTALTDDAPISLHFGTTHNQAVSLHSIARAALAWDALIKELSSVVDASLSVEVDFLSGTVGSRSINSVVRIGRAAQRAAEKEPWVAGPFIAFFATFALAPVNHVADDIVTTVARNWFGHEHDALSNNDVERVARRVDELQRNREATRLRQEIYDAGVEGPRVLGIGVTQRIERPLPALIIPRARFSEFSTRVDVVEDATLSRVVTKEAQEVFVVRPYSKAEERRWKFEGGQRGEFSATMRDPEFLEALRFNKTGLGVGEGKVMVLDLRVKEEMIAGEWKEVEFDVVKVRKPNVGLQKSLEFTPDKPDEPRGQ